MNQNGNIKPHSLFISDLHLCESRPVANSNFIAFLQKTAIKAQSLFILGDFFEYWVGDDSIENHPLINVLDALRTLSSQGVNVYLIHGNRDFLLGEQFARYSGIQLLSDPTLLNIYQKRILLCHGDTLCTDDYQYQQFRTTVRSESWIAQFLAQPLATRVAQVEALRQQSELAKSSKEMSIMDVNNHAVLSLIKDFEYPDILIHGHTHRPNKHEHEVDGHRCERWVLGDWYEQASCLMLSLDGCRAIALDAVL